MSDKSNDEKLRILRERLAQIKQKHNNIIDQEKNDQGINSNDLESANEKNTEKRSSNKFKYLVLIIFLISFTYIFNNFNTITCTCFIKYSYC